MGFFEQGWSNLPELDRCHRSCLDAAVSSRALIHIRTHKENPYPNIHWKEFAKGVFKLLALAEEGYTLYKRASEFSRREEGDLIEETSPMSSNVFDEWLKAQGFSELTSLKKPLSAASQASAYRTFRGALNNLASLESVTFLDFMQVDKLNLGNAETKRTWWNKNLTADNVWTILRAAGTNMRLIYERPRQINSKRLLETGHLFTAAAQFSSPPKIL